MIHLVSIKAASEQLGTKEATIRAWLRSGVIDHVRLGKLIRIRQDVIDHIKEHGLDVDAHPEGV